MTSNIQTINTSKNNIRQISIQAIDLRKDFDRKNIFRNVNFSLDNNDSMAITGKNGSGKSTLIKIIANIFTQSSGEIKFQIDGIIVEKRNYYKYIGFVSPYLSLYDEFTGYENLKIITRIRGIEESNIEIILKRVGLWERRNDLVKIYSSGMKQRIKIAFAILHNPPILLFDEPTSNLDSEGINLVNEIAEEQKQNSILIIATNDEHERSLCEKEINLNSKKEGLK